MVVGAVGGSRGWRGRTCRASAEGSSYDGEAIFAVVDSAAVGEDVYVCALGAELAISLASMVSSCELEGLVRPARAGKI